MRKGDLITSKDTSGYLYEKIRASIASGVYEPGSKISEKQFGIEFEVGRIPLRECLFQLYKSKFLNYETNKGFRIPELSREELRECYPIIWALEKEALCSSAHLLKCRIEELKRINKEFGKTKQIQRALQYDRQFHDIICVTNCNHTLSQILSDLKLRMKRYDMLFFSQTGLITQSFKQHETLIQHIEKQDVKAALATLEANWRVGLEYLLTKIS